MEQNPSRICSSFSLLRCCDSKMQSTRFMFFTRCIKPSKISVDLSFFTPLNQIFVLVQILILPSKVAFFSFLHCYRVICKFFVLFFFTYVFMQMLYFLCYNLSTKLTISYPLSCCIFLYFTSVLDFIFCSLYIQFYYASNDSLRQKLSGYLQKITSFLEVYLFFCHVFSCHRFR